jgi:carboxymethylenebutenolidase
MCFDDDSHPPIPVSLHSGAHGEDIRLTAADGASIAAHLASPGDTPTAQVIVLPDARGLHQFYKELALRFAELGVRALAIDYFARSAENDDRTEPFDYMAHIQQMTTETFGLDLDAAVEAIRLDQSPATPTFTVGFCLGGSLSFWSGTRGYDLAGVIGFYGGLTRHLGAVTPALDWASQIQSPVLGLFGGADQGIPQEAIDQFEQALEKAHAPHEIVVYPGAPHSFFDRKAAEFATASADAWNRVQNFIANTQPVHV